MNGTQALAIIRGYLDDPNGSKYPDAVIMQNFDLEGREMFRDSVKAGSDFHHVYLNLSATLGQYLFDRCYQYKLPTWSHKITKVFIRTSDSQASTNLSAYTWSNPTSVAPRTELPKGSPDKHDGWEYDGNYTLTIWNRTQVEPLTLLVAKVPAPSLKGRIATVLAGNKTQFVVPVENQFGNVIELETGVYMNAEFQCTSTQANLGNNLGEVRRCIDSTARDISTGTRLYILTFDRPWNDVPAKDDVFETITPFPEATVKYQILRTVEATASKKANLPLLQTIQPALGRAREAFMEAVGPRRDDSGPSFYKSRSRPLVARDPDRLPTYPGFSS